MPGRTVITIYLLTCASDSLFNQENPYYSTHSSEIRGLQSTKSSRETLRNLSYFMYKKTHVVFFFFFISWNFTFSPINALMTKGIRTRKCKVTRNEKWVKNFVDGVFFYYRKNYFSGSWNISFDANLLFLKSVSWDFKTSTDKITIDVWLINFNMNFKRLCRQLSR